MVLIIHTEKTFNIFIFYYAFNYLAFQVIIHSRT